jgi:hypothetical protein
LAFGTTNDTWSAKAWVAEANPTTTIPDVTPVSTVPKKAARKIADLFDCIERLPCQKLIIVNFLVDRVAARPSSEIRLSTVLLLYQDIGIPINGTLARAISSWLMGVQTPAKINKK